MLSDEIDLLLVELNLIINSLRKNLSIKKENFSEYITQNFSNSIINKYGISLLEEYLEKKNLTYLIS